MIMCRISAEKSIFVEIELIKECKFTSHKCFSLAPNTYISTTETIQNDSASIILDFLKNRKFQYFFRWNHDFRKSLKNRFFRLWSPKKWLKNGFLRIIFFFCKNSRLELQFGIFTSVVPPLLLPREFFEPLMYPFFL